jgi:hypothetical protein
MRGRSGTIAFLHSAYLEPRRRRRLLASTSQALKLPSGASRTMEATDLSMLSVRTFLTSR